MHVARTPSTYVDKAGNVRRYESVLVRRTYRDGKKVRHETLANLSKLPTDVIATVEAALKGQILVPAESVCTIIRSLPHWHVAAVAAMARALQLAATAGVLLVVGSSLEVYPVAGLPLETLAAGGSLAIVNRGSTPFDRRASVTIDGGAGETLRALAGVLAERP